MRVESYRKKYYKLYGAVILMPKVIQDKKIDYKTKTKTIVLTITESCNLNCIYCYEDYKSHKKMDFKTAINVIDCELSKLPKGITLDVSYMGGEPFLNFELIKSIYEYYEKKGVSNIKYTCSSNGTLIHGDVKKWIKQVFPKFSYNLSLDGIKVVQDYNRDNSFDLIDLDFYLELYKDQGFVKMTLHPDTISYLFDSVTYMHTKGIYPIVNCAYGVLWTNPSVLEEYKLQLLKLIDFYIDNPDIKPCSLLSENIKILAYETDYKPWCGIDRMTVFNAEGKGFPCHFFQDVTIGKELAEKMPKMDTTRLIDYMDPVCKSCCFISLCPICFGSNYKATGSFCKRDINVCSVMKIQLYANAIFQLQRIEKYGLSNLGLNEVEQKELYEAIYKIHQNINPDEI